MHIFINILIFIHFFGLVLGMGSGMAMGTAMRGVDRSTGGFDKLTRALARNGHVGLALLWVTGPLIVWLKYGGFAGLGFWFWVKIAFVVVLTAALGIGAINFRKAREGDRDAAKRAAMIGMLSGISGLIVIFAAVFAFN